MNDLKATRAVLILPVRQLPAARGVLGRMLLDPEGLLYSVSPQAKPLWEFLPALRIAIGTFAFVAQVKETVPSTFTLVHWQ